MDDKDEIHEMYQNGKGRYQGLYDYFKNDEDNPRHYDEHELEEIMFYANRAGQIDENIGYRSERCEHNEAEKVFQEHWQKENIPLSWLNFGYGVLQDLFIETKGPFQNKMIVEINKRDRMIVATVIQWFGSNCGWCFLEEVFKKLGYRITKIEKNK